MMPRPKTSGPTERELEILQVLWDRGPSTIRDIHEELNRGKKRKTAYNSVLTILLIMLEKGYVKRDESDKSHVYEASHDKAEMEERLVKTFMNKVFGGSAMRLVTRALSVKDTSPEEREEIRQLLQEMEEP
jgi:predicted transcriptional regulator